MFKQEDRWFITGPVSFFLSAAVSMVPDRSVASNGEEYQVGRGVYRCECNALGKLVFLPVKLGNLLD